VGYKNVISKAIEHRHNYNNTNATRARTSECPTRERVYDQKLARKLKPSENCRQLIASALVRVQFVYRRRIVHVSVIYRGTGVRDYEYS